MKTYKDKEHSVTVSPFALRGERLLMVCVGLFVRLDPETGECTVESEQNFWKLVPDIFAGIGQAPVLDMGLPKPCAEILVAGSCRTPNARPLAAQEVSFRVGDVRRHIAVFGDRTRVDGVAGKPVPFTAIPLVWERAFGGPDFPANPLGRGLDKDNAPGNLAPNLEDPLHPLLSRDDLPAPVCPFSIDLANPVRRALAGTFDDTWKRTRWPGYPDDMDPDFAHAAQKAQWLRTSNAVSGFFKGDELVEMVGMHHLHPHMSMRLPGLRPRAFVTTAKTFTPFRDREDAADSGQLLPYAKDLDQDGVFRETALALDTVWLFPDVPGVLLLHRGMCPVVDDELDDVLRIFVITERLGEEPRSIKACLEEQGRRMRPAVDIDPAPFVKARKETTRAVKMARDFPKRLEKVKNDVLGRSPVAPLSLGDITHSAMQTIAGSRAVLDDLERKTLAMRESFSHLHSFDMSVFGRMREQLDVQEKHIAHTMRQMSAQLKGVETLAARGRTRSRAAFADAKGLASEGLPQAEIPATLGPLEGMLAKLDGLSPKGVLATPESIAPWHDRGFPHVIAFRRALRRNDALMARLEDLGFQKETLENAWLGFNGAPVRESPASWGLPEAPDFVLPPGLCIPRFKERELAALTVFAMDGPKGEIQGMGEDEAHRFAVPGSAATPLHLSAAQPDGAILVVPEDLSAIFAEQETGDFCHVVSTRDPAQLASLPDLPQPLAPDGGLPLVVLLPRGKADAIVPWRAQVPSAIPLELPEGCPHVLTLAPKGHDLRTLVLQVLPPDVARKHDFAPPLPPRDGPRAPFTLNLPLPSQQEMQDAIMKLIQDVRAQFPDPKRAIAEEAGKMRASLQAGLKGLDLPAEEIAKIDGVLAKAAAGDFPAGDAVPQTVAETMALARKNLADSRAKVISAAEDVGESEAMKAKFLDPLDKAEAKLDVIERRLAPLDALHAEGLAKIEAVRNHELPEDIKKAFEEHGVDPDALKRLTRLDVEAMLARGESLERRNLEGADLSDMDLSRTSLAHAICSGTVFRNCGMSRTDLAFCIAPNADFTGADLRQANLHQTVLKDAKLRGAVLTGARMKLTCLDGADCTGTAFDGADIELCTFSKIDASGANFTGAHMKLCSILESNARGADFQAIQAYKSVLNKTDLAGATFREAILTECLFQGTRGAGVRFTDADLRKFHADQEADFTGALFDGADMREASFRMSRLPQADFWGVNLDGALFVSCDLAGARLDGVSAVGCRFVKCDLAGADLSGAVLREGSLRKCRVTDANLSEANLHGTELHALVAGRTDFSEAVLTATRLDGTEPVLKEEFGRKGGEA